MQQRVRRALRETDKGFTLIELLVVIIIIGILSAVALPVFLNQRKKGIDASLKADLRELATAQETYITDNPGLQGYQVRVAGDGAVGATGTMRLGPDGPDFTASPGNEVVTVFNSSVGAGPDGFCIYARNPGSTKAANAFYYNSVKGGQQPASINAC